MKNRCLPCLENWKDGRMENWNAILQPSLPFLPFYLLSLWYISLFLYILLLPSSSPFVFSIHSLSTFLNSHSAICLKNHFNWLMDETKLCDLFDWLTDLMIDWLKYECAIKALLNAICWGNNKLQPDGWLNYSTHRLFRLGLVSDMTPLETEGC